MNYFFNLGEHLSTFSEFLFRDNEFIFNCISVSFTFRQTYNMLILMEYLFLFKHKLNEMFNLTRHFMFYLLAVDAKLSA